MRFAVPAFLCIILLAFLQLGYGQDSIVRWNVHAKKLEGSKYQLTFSTAVPKGWQLYAPGQKISDIPTTTLQFADTSAVSGDLSFQDSGTARTVQVKLFDNAAYKIHDGQAAFSVVVNIKGTIPAELPGEFKYTFGNDSAFYPLTSLKFQVPLEGGVASTARIKIRSLDLAHPVSNSGDDGTEGKGLWGIFLLGLAGGFIALLTPCVFPLIPLTVSFFTKRAASRQKGLANAMLYGFFIFLIYVLLSLPFYLLDANPEVLNNISTNVWLNLFFFVIFVVFAISFFGYFEITLPGSVANKADEKAGAGNVAGIFFMALTLAIVSFHAPGRYSARYSRVP